MKEYSALFISALIPSLCARLANLIVEDVPSARLYQSFANDAALAAKRVDAQSKPPEKITHLSYVEARQAGSGYGRYSNRIAPSPAVPSDAS